MRAPPRRLPPSQARSLAGRLHLRGLSHRAPDGSRTRSKASHGTLPHSTFALFPTCGAGGRRRALDRAGRGEPGLAEREERE